MGVLEQDLDLAEEYLDLMKGGGKKGHDTKGSLCVK